MKHWAWLAICLVGATGVGQARAADDVEIGYVETFNDAATSGTIVRHGTALPLAILAPVMDGDTLQLPSQRASVSLRLAGESGSHLVTQANQGTPLSVPAPPSHSAWSSLMRWVSSSVDVFDHEQRTQVAANIRGGGNGPLAAPMLASPQVLGAGRHPVSIGWSSPAVVTIRIVAEKGRRVVAAGKGVGGLWTSPPVDLQPGAYAIELQSAKGDGRQALTVVDARQLPMPPAALSDSGLPPELRETAQATWMSAQGPRFALESLQHVAALSQSFPPADRLVSALIDGKAPETPPPN